jgi:hypothetical protein
VEYDYLINATGPKLNFAATPGLGPDGGFSLSVCTAAHAEQTAARFAEVITKLEREERQRLVIEEPVLFEGHPADAEVAQFVFVGQVDAQDDPPLPHPLVTLPDPTT